MDYILINNRYKKIVSNCHTYPSADCGSDHNLLAAKCRLLLQKQKMQTGQRNDRLNISPLQNKKKVTEMRIMLDDSMDQISEIKGNQEKGTEWKKSVIETAKKVLGGGRHAKNETCAKQKKPNKKEEITVHI